MASPRISEEEAWLMIRLMTPQELCKALRRWAHYEPIRVDELLKQVRRDASV